MSRSRSRFHSLGSFIDFDPLLFFIYSVSVMVSWSRSRCHGHCVTVTFRSFIDFDPLLFSMNSVMATVSSLDAYLSLLRIPCCSLYLVYLSWSHGHCVTVTFRFFIAFDPLLFSMNSVMATVSRSRSHSHGVKGHSQIWLSLRQFARSITADLNQ